MTLSQLLKPGLILTQAVCTSKCELMDAMIERIYNEGTELPISRQELARAIRIREEIGGTMLPSGLSIPHARIKDFDGFVFSLAAPHSPVFHEGFQLRLMAIMISGQSGGPYYLPCIAALSKLSRDADCLVRLAETDDADEFISIIAEKNIQLD